MNGLNPADADNLLKGLTGELRFRGLSPPVYKSTLIKYICALNYDCFDAIIQIRKSQWLFPFVTQGCHAM